MNKSFAILASVALAAALSCNAFPFSTQSQSSGVATPTAVTFDVLCPSSIPDARQAYNSGSEAQEAGRLDEAEQLYEKAIELDPGYCDAMDNLGLLLRREGRVDEAVEWYQKSLEVKPDNNVAQQNLGMAYLTQGENDLAAETFQKLIDMDPSSGEGYYGMGLVYLTQERYEEAIPYFEQAEERYRDTSPAYQFDALKALGMSHWGLGDCVTARKYLEPIYSQDDAVINYYLGVCYLTAEPKDVELGSLYIQRAQELGMEIPADILQAAQEG